MEGFVVSRNMQSDKLLDDMAAHTHSLFFWFSCQRALFSQGLMPLHIRTNFFTQINTRTIN